MTKVECNVSRCKFWGEGNVCKASKISVKDNILYSTNNDFGDLSLEFGEEYDDLMDSYRGEKEEKGARTSLETCCETMRPRVVDDKNK